MRRYLEKKNRLSIFSWKISGKFMPHAACCLSWRSWSYQYRKIGISRRITKACEVMQAQRSGMVFSLSAVAAGSLQLQAGR